jgi:serine/threonine protein kinase
MAAAALQVRDGIVFGRYLLLRPIGRGGMAEVWRARLVGVNDFAREIVIKRILPHLTQEPELVAMFTAEAKLCARLNHPNIVQVFEFSSVDNELFLAMEYVPGVNLSEVLGRLGAPMPVGMAVQIVRDVCLALAYAHGAVGDDGAPMAIIHRDVSPSNIMVRFDGNVKLVDFGIAKVLSAADPHTRTGVLKGKLGYLSPEAATGEVEIDHRTDIFGAGVILHELLTGQRLFKGRDDLNTLALVRKCEVSAPSASRPEVSAEIDRLCLQALARDREARFPTARTMAQALTRVMNALEWDELSTAAFLREHGIQAPALPDAPGSPTLTRDAGTPRRRRSMPALLAGAILLLAVPVAWRMARTPLYAPPAVAAPPPTTLPAPPATTPPATTPPAPPATTPPAATTRLADRPKTRKLKAAKLREPKPATHAPNLLNGEIDRTF